MIILVLAARFEHFREWCHKNRINPLHKNLLFLSNELKVRGIRDPFILRLPGYREHQVWDNPHFADVLNARAWRSTKLLEITETEARVLLEIANEYSWLEFTYDSVRKFVELGKGDVSRETDGVPEGN